MDVLPASATLCKKRQSTLEAISHLKQTLFTTEKQRTGEANSFVQHHTWLLLPATLGPAHMQAPGAAEVDVEAHLAAELHEVIQHFGLGWRMPP